MWCVPDWNWHRPWSSVSAGENVIGFVMAGLNRATVIMRPWEPVSWGTALSPAPLSGNSNLPYNVGACTYSLEVGSNMTLPASGSTLYIWVTSNCYWSAAPTPPATSSGSNPYPSWFTPVSAAWQNGSGYAVFTYATNSSSSQRGPFNLTVAGQTIAVTQLAGGSAPPAPTGLSPNNTGGVSTSPTLSWGSTANTTYYNVYLQYSFQGSVTGTSYTIPGPPQSYTNYAWYVDAVNSYGSTQSATANLMTGGAATSGLDFYPVTPCRVADTVIGAQQAPTLNVLSNSCGIPSTAAAYSFNITAIPQTGYLGMLKTYPAGQSQPNVSTLNSYNGSAIANAAIVPAGTSGEINVYVTDATEVKLDINGYFAPPLSNGLEFFAVTPCRIADTRTGAGFTGAFGPPSLVAYTTRPFTVPSSSCGIPSTAGAYSLNFTVVPPGALQELIAWPVGPSLPNVSMLSDPTGAVLADAAIVPAGTGGAINVYPYAATDMLFDINGYFAAPSSQGLHFYPVTPCRVADTRSGAGFSGAFGPPSLVGGGTPRFFPIPSSSCGIPTTAAAYSLNFTVVPPQGQQLGNLTTWPTGQSMPNVSTLNDSAGIVLANAAIVAAGTGGAISVWVTDSTDMCLDINGYFAP
jgi:hypothetical protein